MSSHQAAGRPDELGGYDEGDIRRSNPGEGVAKANDVEAVNQ